MRQEDWGPEDEGGVLLRALPSILGSRGKAVWGGRWEIDRREQLEIEGGRERLRTAVGGEVGWPES